MNAAFVSSCLRRYGATLSRRASVAQGLSRRTFSSEANYADEVGHHPAGPLHGVRVLDMSRCVSAGCVRVVQ